MALILHVMWASLISEATRVLMVRTHAWGARGGSLPLVAATPVPLTLAFDIAAVDVLLHVRRFVQVFILVDFFVRALTAH
jgi:hypothetical protein